MSWDKATEASKNAKSGGKFVRLENDGDKAIGAFCGEPHTKEIVFNEKKGTYEDYDAKLHSADDITPRFVMNFFEIVGGKGSMKIIEMNNKTFKDVLKVRDKYGLEKKTFEITRNGKKGDSKTTYTVLPEETIDAELRKAIDAATLHDVAKASDKDDDSTDMKSHDKAKKGDKPKEEPKAETKTETKTDAVIDPSKVQGLVARLKVQPREKINEMLAKYGIAQVKALKASDEAAFEKDLDKLEGKVEAPAAEVVDPFAD